MRKKKVLIVDDDAFIRRPLEFLLKREGFETEVAGDGEASLDAMERDRPDLVCLDVMMPVRDGFSTCEEIRRRPHLAATPVIFLSAKGQESDVARGAALGAIDFLAKPYSPADLVSKIRAVLGEQRFTGGGS